MTNADDLRHCRDICVDYLQQVANEDWTAPVPDLDMHVSFVVAHMTQAQLWYAIDLAAGGEEIDAAVDPQISHDAAPRELIQALHTLADVCAHVINGSAPDQLGFHPWGIADPSGFAAMACDEMLVHTYDASLALGKPFEPPVGLATKVLARLFPWAETSNDPWRALLWANGRVAHDGKTRLSSWKWHCAPLADWDGTVPA